MPGTALGVASVRQDPNSAVPDAHLHPSMGGRFTNQLTGYEIVALYRLATLGPITRLATTPRK